MRFHVQKSVLLKELILLQGIAAKKQTIPILSSIKISAESGSNTITLVSNNLDTSLRTQCEAVETDAGSVCVPAKQLLEVIRSLPEAVVQCHTGENDWLHIMCKDIKFKAIGTNGDHFPATPASSTVSCTIPVATLKGLIDRTIYATSREESRYAINGVLLEIDGNNVRMVATDGHRLSMVSKQIDGTFDKQDILIPRQGMTELSTMLSDDGAVQCCTDDNHIFFRIENRELSACRSTGQFPKYMVFLEGHRDIIISVDTSDFAQSVRRADLMANSNSRGLTMDVSADNKMTISSISAESGEHSEVIAAVSNCQLRIGFNAGYLLDFLNTVKSERIQLELTDAQSPVMIKPVQDADGFDYAYIIMPLRLL